MATHLLQIAPNGHTRPDVSGTVVLEPSSLNLNSNDRYPHFVLAFTSQSARQGIHGKFRVPKNYVGTPVLVIEWATTATTGNVVWDFDYRAIAAGESLDPSTDQQSVSVTDGAPGTARLREQATVSLTAANLVADDEVEFNLYRDAADAADTLAASAFIFGAYFQFADA